MKEQNANSENQGEELVSTNPENASKTRITKWVITFDEKPESHEDERIDDAVKEEKNCLKHRIPGTGGLVELWELEGTDIEINTNIQTILSGVNSTNTHSELNIGIEFKEESSLKIDVCDYELPLHANSGSDKQEILIAVLDTGVRTDLIPKEFLWNENEEKNPPFKGQSKGLFGKSFIKNEGAVEDDDKNFHGTLVSSFIINQFKDSAYRVKIMNLKTHDANGKGDLFAIIDAINFAMKEGAKIINASWGFYNSQLPENSILEKLIKVRLFNEGMLFVTVSGNKFVDESTSENYFYPAEFGKGINDDEKSMIVVTTVSPKGYNYSKIQNFSPEWVDFGVPCDIIKRSNNTSYYMFHLPFVKKADPIDPINPDPSDNLLIGGASFAAAIAAGRIGTFLNESKFPDIYPKNKTANTKRHTNAKGPADEKKPNVEIKPIDKKKLIDKIGSDLFDQKGELKSGIKGGRILRRKIMSSQL